MALTKREAFARLMEHMCEHDGNGGHGYSQAARDGYGTETVDLGGGVVVTIKGGDRDCSSAVCSCLKAVGVDIHGATYTGNMRKELLKSGLFEWVTRTSGARRGDIYLNESRHTAVCLGGGKLAEFSISETGGITGKRGDQTGWESHVCSFYTYSHGWDGTLRWKSAGGDAQGGTADAPASQGAGLLLDCDAGVKTVRAWADQLGLTGSAADGYINHQYSGNRRYLKNLSSVIYAYDGTPSPFALALQRRIGSKNLDGILGAVDVENLRSYMKREWGYKMTSDGKGVFGANTAYNVQHSLNLGLWGR